MEFFCSYNNKSHFFNVVAILQMINGNNSTFKWHISKDEKIHVAQTLHYNRRVQVVSQCHWSGSFALEYSMRTIQ